jgi:hypothetical protein
MKNFFKFILYFIPIPILIVTINYIVDPSNLFNNKYEKGIADYLAKGYNVTNVVNYDERLLQKYFIEKMKEPPSEIVLGSSQIMIIGSMYSTEASLINNGVSGASLEDYLAIYQLYETKGFKIKKVLIGLSPWLLNDNHAQSRWKSLADEYYSFVTHKLKIKTKKNFKTSLYNFSKYNQLLSSSYFKTSLEYLFKDIDKEYKPTRSIINNGFTRLIDGSIFYDKLYRSVSFDEIENKSKSTILTNPIYSLGNYTNLSENYKTLFTAFVEYLQKQNIEVEFFIPPYHPIVYDYFSKNEYYRIVFKTEIYFKDFALNHKIKLFGSYDPSKYSLDNSFFFDGLHCNEKAIEKIFKIN